MRAITHIAASTVAAAIAAAAVKSPSASGLLLFGGFLDVDHVHHFISSGLPANPGAMFHSVLRNEKQLEKKYSITRKIPESFLFPLFHCVEFTLLVAAAGILAGSDFLLWGASGTVLHLLMDIRSYPCSPKFFSILWRFSHRSQLLKEWKVHCSGVYW